MVVNEVKAVTVFRKVFGLAGEVFVHRGDVRPFAGHIIEKVVELPAVGHVELAFMEVEVLGLSEHEYLGVVATEMLDGFGPVVLGLPPCHIHAETVDPKLVKPVNHVLTLSLHHGRIAVV